jgi:hypothetical protein
MGAQRLGRFLERASIWVEAALCRRQRTVPGNLPEHVDRNSRVGHPGQARMAEIVAHQLLVPKLAGHIVPMRGVPENGCADSSALGAEEEAIIGALRCKQTSSDHWSDFLDQRNRSGPLALRALWVDAPSRRAAQAINPSLGRL